jgi:co-chaperonin GroES (HSP10)
VAVAFALLSATVVAYSLSVAAQANPGSQSTAQRVIGVLKSINGNSIVVTSDAGNDVSAVLSPETRLLRVAPGQKDLSGATSLRPEDLKVGDRILVRGTPQSTATQLQAISVIVMRQEDVTAKHEQEQEDWQKRGTGGLVTAVDAANGLVTISTGGLGQAAKSLTIRITSKTVLRRYASNSIKFDDAKVAPIDQIKVGDQLRARGARNSDGTEMTADEIVSGTFRNIAGTVAAVDSNAGLLTVQDAITKKNVTVKVGPDSTVKKLPTEIAQRIAMRLKGAGNGNGGAAPGQRPPQAGTGRSSGASPSSERSGPPDLQRFISRMPDSKLGDLQKGDAVMIVSTDATDAGSLTAITLLAGVEPILTASPNAAMLTPWSLSSAAAEAAMP